MAQKALNGSVKHTDFDSIRNKSSVRAVLMNLGFKPCNEVNPTTWRQPKNLRALKDARSAKGEVIDGGKSVKRSVGRPKTSSDMPTKKGQQILEQMLENGFYDVGEFDMSQSYLSNIIGQMRELGYKISSITGESGRVVRYELKQ